MLGEQTEKADMGNLKDHITMLEKEIEALQM
jgi:hypothetical protein